MSDICFLSILQPLGYMLYFLMETVKKTQQRPHGIPLVVTGPAVTTISRFQWQHQVVRISGTGHIKRGKSLLLGLTTAVASLDQLCNVICITFGEGASKPVYLTRSKSLQKIQCSFSYLRPELVSTLSVQSALLAAQCPAHFTSLFVP